jgi:hypothetical protein
MVLLPTLALGQTVPVSFHWTPPIEGAPVDHYIVYASQNDEEFRFETIRSDTTYVFEAQLGVEYRIRVSGVSAAGHEGIMSVPSDVAYLPEPQPEDGSPPPSSDLRANFPNPFNPETTIRYGIPESLSTGGHVSLELYNLRGVRVRTFPVDRNPGWHEATWNGRDENGDMQPSGHYIVRLVADGKVSTWKMTMVK